MEILPNFEKTPIFDVFTAFRLDYVLDADKNENLILFNGSLYGKPSIDDLKRLKSMLENTIDNYEIINQMLVYENQKLLIEYHKPQTEYKKVIKINSGFIYLVKCNTTKYYKIGLTTKNLIARIRQLKTSNPTIELIKSFEVKDVKIEKELHLLFKDKNINREWFKLTKSDIEILTKYILKNQ